jgi:cell division protease FtsH
MVIVFNIFSENQHKGKLFIPTSYFEKLIKEGDIKNVVIRGNTLTGYTKEGAVVKTFISPSDSYIYRELRQYNVTYTYKPVERESWIGSFVISWLPTILFFLFFILLIRQFQAGGNKVMSFSKSRAKIFIDNKPKVSFNDVAGIDEIKEEVKEIVDFLKNPKKYQKL